MQRPIRTYVIFGLVLGNPCYVSGECFVNASKIAHQLRYRLVELLVSQPRFIRRQLWSLCHVRQIQERALQYFQKYYTNAISPHSRGKTKHVCFGFFCVLHYISSEKLIVFILSFFINYSLMTLFVPACQLCFAASLIEYLES